MYIELLLQFQYGIINYFGISFLYYWYHRFLHSKYSGPLSFKRPIGMAHASETCDV
jgi:hypothetical protein